MLNIFLVASAQDVRNIISWIWRIYRYVELQQIQTFSDAQQTNLLEWSELVRDIMGPVAEKIQNCSFFWGDDISYDK